MRITVELEEFEEVVEAIVKRVVEDALGTPTDWLDERGAAVYLVMTLEAVRAATRRGQLPCHKSATNRRRYSRRELDAWLKAND